MSKTAEKNAIKANSEDEAIIRFDKTKLKEHFGEYVRETVEESLNALLSAEADYLCGARRYERSDKRTDYRAGSYPRKLQTQAGELN